MCASIIFALVLGTWFQLPLNYWQLIITGLIIAVFSQAGDLVESMLKRNMKTKDAGHLLPGHGGILDRIDSHLLIAPISYFLIILINNQG
jgi:phosphatidate cytidylyltransferase